MAYVLRVIRQSRWLDYLRQVSTDADVPADPLGDLHTRDNRLSVFIVNAQNDSEIERVVAACAANRETLQNVDYALLDAARLAEADVGIESTRGETPDDQVNDCHRDLVSLTGLKLVGLARLILAHGSMDRVLWKQVAALIRGAGFDKTRCRLKPDEWRKIEDAASS